MMLWPRPRSFLVVIVLALAVSACSVAPRKGPDAGEGEPRRDALASLNLAPDLEERILALDPKRISDKDVRETLAAGPAPQIIGLHGGIYPVHLAMETFARFLRDMGYPIDRIRNPGDGRLSHSPYENSAQIAGLIAWYYERDGLRPMMIGHSQGGMQAVKVLHELNGEFDESIPVWNPLTDAAEERTTIIDPITRRERPVIGLKTSYVSAVAAGGAAMLLPNQWIMAGRLRTIPDTTVEFTGFFIGVDLVAWNTEGDAKSDAYHHNGMAEVRNVTLPASYNHVLIPVTRHLSRDPKMRAWINHYTPYARTHPPIPEGDSDNLLWAADVWFSIKKHWCLELQRLIRAKRTMQQARRTSEAAEPRKPIREGSIPSS